MAARTSRMKWDRPIPTLARGHRVSRHRPQPGANYRAPAVRSDDGTVESIARQEPGEPAKRSGRGGTGRDGASQQFHDGSQTRGSESSERAPNIVSATKVTAALQKAV